MEQPCPHRSPICDDVIRMSDCDLPHDTDMETSPWWQHMDLCTVDKVFCSTQVSQIPSYGTQDHPPQTFGFGIWHHSRTSVLPMPLRSSCGIQHTPPEMLYQLFGILSMSLWCLLTDRNTEHDICNLDIYHLKTNFQITTKWLRSIDLIVVQWRMRPKIWSISVQVMSCCLTTPGA